MGIKDIFNARKIKMENEELKKSFHEMKKLYEEIGGKEIVEINAIIKEMQQKKDKVQTECIELTKQLQSLQFELSEKQSEIITLDEAILLQNLGLYEPKYSFNNSYEYKTHLDNIRTEQKDMIKNDTTMTENIKKHLQSSNTKYNVAAANKMIKNLKSLCLRAFNTECDSTIETVKFNNIDSLEKKIRKSYDFINKIGEEHLMMTISTKYLNLKLQELYLSYEYTVKKQEEKEEQKRFKEELREQAKLEQEIKQARDKITKERNHFNKAVIEIKSKIHTTTDENELKLLNEKLVALQTSITELDKEERLVDYREKNAKAGYIYIISNIGAFGENVYKIGMTRRLEPMDRIDELGSASVPFAFDVHALIFSENAPELESKLHKHFYKNRINKLNNRKEFFRADIKEIEQIIKDNYDKVLDVIDIPPAEQYRQSLLIKE